MTQQEIKRIQQEIANKTPGELVKESADRRNFVEKMKRMKKLRKYK